MPRITGNTRLYAVLGDPVAQVQAPGLLNPLFARLGVDAVLIPVHVRPAQLGEVMAGLRAMENLDGMLVTVPHKVAVCRYADRLGPFAAVAGSANALRRESNSDWLADNFDGVGFVRGLREAGHELAGRNVSLVGAGGAGSAIAAAVLAARAERLSIHDTCRGRAEDLVARLVDRWPGRAVAADTPETLDVDVAINATPLGLHPGDPLPFAPEALSQGCVVADIIMKPARTRLLRRSATLGHPVHAGIHTLHAQLDSYRDFFDLG